MIAPPFPNGGVFVMRAAKSTLPQLSEAEVSARKMVAAGEKALNDC